MMTFLMGPGEEVVIGGTGGVRTYRNVGGGNVVVVGARTTTLTTADGVTGLIEVERGRNRHERRSNAAKARRTRETERIRIVKGPFR